MHPRDVSTSRKRASCVDTFFMRSAQHDRRLVRNMCKNQSSFLSSVSSGAIFFLALAMPLSAHSQELAVAPGKIVRSLTADPGYFTEPGIAVNPHNPQQVVAVFQDNAHAAYSVNGGHDWQVARGGGPPDHRLSGDGLGAFCNPSPGLN